MKKHFERTRFTSKVCADFGMHKSFKDRSKLPDTSRYKFFAHFTLKVFSTAKSTQALDENQPLSKHAACLITQYFERTLHFQMQMFI